MIKEKRQHLLQLLVSIFEFVRAAFGLKVLKYSKDGSLKVSILQRILGLTWFGIFIAASIAAGKIDVVFNLKLKNVIIVSILPKITGVLSTTSFLFTFILTHALANKRKNLIEELMHPPVNNNLRGSNYIIIIGILQTIYSYLWYFTSAQFLPKESSYIQLLVLELPTLVSACFLVDYVTGIVILLDQFNSLNQKLKDLRKQSLQSKNYPKNEKFFQKIIKDIADEHRTLCKIGTKLNDMYSCLLFLNTSILCGMILSSSYIGLWALTSMFTEQKNVVMLVESGLYFVFNVLTLLMIVEVTVQLYEEVSYQIFLVVTKQSKSLINNKLKCTI